VGGDIFPNSLGIPASPISPILNGRKVVGSGIGVSWKSSPLKLIFKLVGVVAVPVEESIKVRPGLTRPKAP
jgi:hypothetical protein